MSESLGMVASFSLAVLASPECAWHHQNTAFTRFRVVSPLWFRRTALSWAFTPPSILLLVYGSGPAFVSSGSRKVNSVPAETSDESDLLAFLSLSCVYALFPSTSVVSSRKSDQKPHQSR